MPSSLSPPLPLHSSPPEGLRPSADEADAQLLLTSPAPATDDDLAMGCLLDTAKRTALGIWVYPAMWMIVALFTGVAERWPWLTWGNVVGLLLMAVVRFVLNRNLGTWLHSHRTLAERSFQGLTLAIAGYWGLLTSVCIWLAPTEGVSWIMLTLTVAFCAGGNTLFGINAGLRVPYPLTMIVPVVIAQALQPTPEHKVMMGMEILLTLYLHRSSAIVHQDYWDARFAQRLSAQQARALELASLTDGLTQVFNRLFFDRQYAHEWARQCRHGHSVALLLVDIDHFKRVNDQHGHPVGDACLKQVAQALRRCCSRSTDVVARYGGEEFVVLLPHTDADGAVVVAERMREQVRHIEVSHQGQRIDLSCSIGVACTVPSHTQDPASLLQAADQALYDAKHAGRNRVVLSARPSDSAETA